MGFAYTLLALITVPLAILTLLGGISRVLFRFPTEQEMARAVEQAATEKPGIEGTERTRR
jgi:hypothetical protein